MSATEAARQKLDTLRKQQASYRETLHNQEAELRRLQNEVYQSRTVVEKTMPGEIEKAYGEYLEIIKKSSQFPHSQKESLALGLEEDFLETYNHHHNRFSSFFFSNDNNAAGPGSFLSLLTFTTIILYTLWENLAYSLTEKILAQIFVLLGFFFPAVAYAQRQQQQQQQQGGSTWSCVTGYAAGSRRSNTGGKRTGSTRFAPIHM